MRQIAATDARGARPQRLDRPDHAAGEKHPGQDGKAKGGQQNEPQSLQRRIKRRIGLTGRQLDEDPPAERCYRCRGREYLATFDVFRFLHRLRWAVAFTARRTHLRKPRHVRVAQHQANVGMRDQPALRIHHIGMAALADLDLRDHVPDQLEIDFGDAHAGIAPGAGNGERHVRLGFTTEVNRPVIDLACHRFRELRIIGEVGAARDHVHGQPRHPQPLFAAGVDLRQLGNCGHLPQQPQCIEAALLDGAGRPRQLRRPAELALDLLAELPDLGGGGFRLFALDADEGNLVLLVVEVDVENTV